MLCNLESNYLPANKIAVTVSDYMGKVPVQKQLPAAFHIFTELDNKITRDGKEIELTDEEVSSIIQIVADNRAYYENIVLEHHAQILLEEKQ